MPDSPTARDPAPTQDHAPSERAAMGLRGCGWSEAPPPGSTGEAGARGIRNLHGERPLPEQGAFEVELMMAYLNPSAR